MCKVKVMRRSKKPRKCGVTYFEPKYLNIANKIEGIWREQFDCEGRPGAANVKYLKMINKRKVTTSISPDFMAEIG